MSYDGELKFDTGIDTSGFKLGMNQLSSICESGFNDLSAVVSAGLSLLESSFTATFDVLTSAASSAFSFISDSISTTMDFDASLSNTMGLMSSKYKQGTEEYAQALDTLSTKAQDLGASTQFSASQVSDAFGYMALAGWDVEQQTGAIEGVLNLAAASGMELANASDMVTDYLSAFSMEADQAGYFADMLAYSSTNSNTSVEQLGEAYKNCAANMNASGQSVETTTALLAKMADQGEKGSTAGTKLTAIMRDLKNSAEDGAIAVGDTAVAVYDSQGQMRDLGEIMVDIQNATKGMTDEQRDLALGSSFTADSIAGVNLILNAGADSVVSFTEELKNCGGTAEDVATTMNDNLSGDVTAMQSAFEGLQIALGESLNDGLRTIVQNATGYLAELRSAFLDGGWSGLATSLGDVFNSLLTDNESIVQEFIDIGTEVIAGLIKGINANSENISKIISTLLTSSFSSSGSAFTGFYDIGISMLTSIAQGISKNSKQISNTVTTIVSSIVTTLSNNVPTLLSSGITILTAIISGISDNLPNLLTTMGNLVKKIVGAISNSLPTLLNLGIGILKTLLNGLISALPELLNFGITLITTLVDFVLTNLPMLVETGMQLLVTLLEGLNEGLPTLIEMIPQIINSIIQIFMDNFGLIMELGVTLLVSICQAIVENLPTLIPTIIELILYVIQILTDNIDTIFQAGVDILFAIMNGIIESLPILIEKAHEIINAFCDEINAHLLELVAVAIALIVTLAQGLWDNRQAILDNIGEIALMIFNIISMIDLFGAGKKILTALKDGITSMKGSVKSSVQEIFNTIKDNLSGLPAKLKEIGANMIKGLKDGFLSMLESVKNEIVNSASSIVNGIKSFLGIQSPSRLMADTIGRYMPLGIAVGFEEETPDAIDDMNRTLNAQITGLDVDEIYSQMQGLNYSQGSVPSYSGVVQGAYSSGNTISSDEDSVNHGTIVVENYLFKNGQKLNSFVINAGVLENARSGGVSI